MEETLKSIWYKNSPSPDLSLPFCFFFHDIQFTVWLIMTFFSPSRISLLCNYVYCTELFFVEVTFSAMILL